MADLPLGVFTGTDAYHHRGEWMLDGLYELGPFRVYTSLLKPCGRICKVEVWLNDVLVVGDRFTRRGEQETNEHVAHLIERTLSGWLDKVQELKGPR